MENTLMEVYQDYIDLLAYFCYVSTRLSKMVFEKEENGTEPEKELAEYWADQLRKARKKLLKAKEQLGFPGGLSFLENNTFEGIQIRDGVIYGDPYDALEIVEAWEESFPKDATYSYQYEVGQYLKAYCQEDLDYLLPEQFRKQEENMVEEKEEQQEQLIEENKEKGGIIRWVKNRFFNMMSAS